MTQLLTNSRMRCFRECPRKHDIAYVRGFRPAVEPEALRFGSLVHAALEAYWISVMTGGSELGVCHEVIANRATDAFEQARADEMVAGYISRWFASDVEEYEVLAVEPQFETALWNPKTNAESRTFRLAGKIDAILKRRSDARTLVREFKTSSEDISDGANYWSKLALDPQISAYILGAASLGHEIDECLYDVALKPAQRPFLATPVDQRKFTKDGRLYAQQRDHDETPDEYRLRIREAIMSDLPRYFQRRSIPRTQSQVRDFLIDAWQQGRTMREMELDGFAPRNPDACFRFGTCQFWSLCSTGTEPQDDPTNFVKVENVHQELTLPKEESK